MNARAYAPKLAKFTRVDPVIKNLLNGRISTAIARTVELSAEYPRYGYLPAHPDPPGRHRLARGHSSVTCPIDPVSLLKGIQGMVRPPSNA
jgi:hypothetical protein